jgi:hypothetical protein
MSYCGQGMTSSSAPLSGSTRAPEIANLSDSPRGSAFDSLLAVLNTPALAADLSRDPHLWTEIRRLADIHRFSGLLAHSTSQWLPASERPWRDRTLMMHHRRHYQFLNQQRMFSDAFRAEGIPCVALKGPLLAERLHPVPFLKWSHDLDLFVRVADIPRSVQVMQAMGFSLAGDCPWKLLRKYTHHLNFTGAGEVHTVELHYSLKAGAHLLPGEEFIGRAINWRSGEGTEYLFLSPADEVFYLIIHAAGHAFQRFRWLYDALAAAKTLNGEDRVRVRSQALAMGLTGYFVAADMACREFFGEGLPLDLDGFTRPWLWSPLQPGHVRAMAQRKEYKFGIRALDVCRMAGSPLSALRLCAQSAAGKLPIVLYRLGGGATGPDVLANSLDTR